MLSLHLGDLEGDLLLVCGDGSFSSLSLLSDLNTEESESFLTFSEALSGLLESVDERIALVRQGDQILGLDLDLVIFLVLDVVSLLDSDLSLDAVDGDDLVLDLLFFDVDLALDLVDDLSLVADLDLVLVELVLLGADLGLDAVELVAEMSHLVVVAGD